MPECIFCKIIAGEISSVKIYEDHKILAFLDISPINSGHTLVIPKNHSENITEASEDDLVEVIKAVKKLAPAVSKGVGADGFNLTVNNGEAAGQVVDHLHFHIIPRFKDDGHALWSGTAYPEGKAKEVAEKIKNEL